MKQLKKIVDFQNENQELISNLETSKIFGGRGDCTCVENYPTDGGCDTETWTYLDTSNGKKPLSLEPVVTQL